MCSDVPHANWVIKVSQSCKTVSHYLTIFCPISSNRMGRCTSTITPNITGHTGHVFYRCIIQFNRRQNVIWEIRTNFFSLISSTNWIHISLKIFLGKRTPKTAVFELSFSEFCVRLVSRTRQTIFAELDSRTRSFSTELHNSTAIWELRSNIQNLSEVGYGLCQPSFRFSTWPLPGYRTEQQNFGIESIESVSLKMF